MIKYFLGFQGVGTIVFVTFGRRLTYDCETFEKCSFLFKFREGDNFNHRNTLSISRIKI
jgi:hypothetical protein